MHPVATGHALRHKVPQQRGAVGREGVPQQQQDRSQGQAPAKDAVEVRQPGADQRLAVQPSAGAQLWGRRTGAFLLAMRSLGGHDTAKKGNYERGSEEHLPGWQ